MAVKTRGMQVAQLRDLSGGVNLRDAPPELAANEVLDALNISFDERGGGPSRLGYLRANVTQYDAAAFVENEFWSDILGNIVVQAGAKLYLGLASTTIRKTFTTGELVTFCEMNSLIVACHPTDGLFTSPDGITWTAVADADAPKGTCVTVWQNKVWVGRPDGSVHWSAATDPLTWSATDFNKLWEKDQDAIVALHGGSGQDILGKPGLLCFKQESVCRVNDAATGAYTLVDGTVGAAGPLSVVGVGPKVIALSKRGIFWWREDQSGMVEASNKLLPLWDPAQVDLASQGKWCAGRRGHRAVFSLRRAGSAVNDLSLEYNPDQGWIAPRSDAMTCYATSTGQNEVLYGGSPTRQGQVYILNSGGTDDGALIHYRLQTRWVELDGGFNVAVWQARLQGRGSGTVTVLHDYASSGGDSEPFDFGVGETLLYDSGLQYDTGLTYPIPVYQATDQHFGLGTCRQISLLFEGDVQTTVDGPPVIGADVNPQVGAFALFGVTWLFAPLAYA